MICLVILVCDCMIHQANVLEGEELIFEGEGDTNVLVGVDEIYMIHLVNKVVCVIFLMKEDGTLLLMSDEELACMVGE